MEQPLPIPTLSDALGQFSPTAWLPPPQMSVLAWRQLGEQLAKHQSKCHWWIGDWWINGEHEYGARKAMTQAGDWHGPVYGTCKNAARVCINFREKSRRRDLLTFKHHAEVSALSPEHADAALDWAQQTNASTRQLREHIKTSKPSMEGLTPKQVLDKLLAWCVAREMSKEACSQARRICRNDIELAKSVLRGDRTLNNAHAMVRAKEHNEHQTAAAAHEATVAVAVASNVRQLPTIAERAAEAKRIAHLVPQAVAMLFEASKANIAPVWLQKDMTNEEINEIDTHAPHVVRYLKYVIETWAHTAHTKKGVR